MRAKARITARGLVKRFGAAAPGVAKKVVEGLKELVPDDENTRIQVADDQAFWESIREEALKEVTGGMDDQAFWESIREEALKGTKEEGTLSDLDYAARHKLGNAISLLGAAASSIRREVDPGAREAEFGRLDSYLKSASDARDEIMNGLKALEENRDVIRKSDLNWLMNKTEQCSERYMEAEKFILELAEMNWYQRMFCFGKIF